MAIWVKITGTFCIQQVAVPYVVGTRDAPSGARAAARGRGATWQRWAQAGHNDEFRGRSGHCLSVETPAGRARHQAHGPG